MVRFRQWLVALVTIVCAGAAPASARSIADQPHRFIDTHGFPTAGDFPEAITPVVERLAVRGIDFPVTATTPSLTYRYGTVLP